MQITAISATHIYMCDAAQSKEASRRCGGRACAECDKDDRAHDGHAKVRPAEEQHSYFVYASSDDTNIALCVDFLMSLWCGKSFRMSVFAHVSGKAHGSHDI